MISSSNAWLERAAAWELLAFSFRHPDGELAYAVCNEGWVQEAQEVSDALGLDLAFAPLPSGNLDESEVLSALRIEATRLFVHAPTPAVSAYESVWRAGDDGVPVLLFVSPHAMAVERFMRTCGLVRPAGTNEPLDFIATECELLHVLALRAAASAQAAEEACGEGAGSSDGEAESRAESMLDGDAPGGSWAAAYELFFEDHAHVWMGRFGEAVLAEARHDLYRSAAQLLIAVDRV